MIIGPINTPGTYQNPLGAHIADLRNLARGENTSELLRTKFGRADPTKNDEAALISGHISQALEFTSAAERATAAVLPVLQYYAFLNLAIAVVLAYRPPNHLAFRRHGLRDLSHALTNIQPDSEIVEVSEGALSLINCVFGGGKLAGLTINLADVVRAIPMVQAETARLYGDSAVPIRVRPTCLAQATRGGRVVSSIEFFVSDGTSHDGRAKEALTHGLSQLRGLAEKYDAVVSTDYLRSFWSKRDWEVEKFAEAEAAHRHLVRPLVNFGGHRIDLILHNAPNGHYFWYMAPDGVLLPTVTAMLILSFFLSSLARYRPTLLLKLANTSFSHVSDAFLSEATGVLIPTFRNMLFKEETVYHPMQGA